MTRRPTRPRSSASSVRAAESGCSRRTRRSSPSMRPTSTFSARSWGCSASYERRLDGAHQRAEVPALPAPGSGMSGLTPLHRTLEQELLAVLRGASLECPVCGEFVLHDGPAVRCPAGEMVLHGRAVAAGTEPEPGVQAG